MTDERPDVAEDASAEPRPVRRRRSSSHSRHRRAKGVHSKVPFTSLRFTRPRLPGLTQAIGLAVAVAALGLSAWSLRITGRTGLSLTQTRTLLAVNTRGAAAGRLAADQLAAGAQADAARMMAAQDLARQQAARAAYTAGFAPPVYAPSPPEGEGAPTSVPPPAIGASAYGAAPYGAAAYGNSQQVTAPAASGGAMGYTLPQATPH